jgi:gamma-glutamyltranspeptidase/glutathione hydrolase
MDKNNNIASITTTNGEGCGHFIPEYGIMMNNMLGEQDLNPYGFHQWKTIRRLPTMICPTIILKDNKPLYVLGSGGSNRIRSAITQVILNLIIKNMSLEEAINAPRIHLEGHDIFLEPGINLEDKCNHLNINPFKEKSLFFGGVNCVSTHEAIGDFRRGGIGEVF